MDPTLNIFCQPTPVKADIFLVVEWSLDNATWQAFPAPAATQIYVRVTARRDFSNATFMEFIKPGVGGPSFTVTPGENTATIQTTVGGITAADREITVQNPDGDLDCGLFTFA